MNAVRHLAIVALGDEDLVNGLRLAGVSRCHVIGEHNTRDEVREALSALLDEPDIGVIVISEGYVNHVEDLLAEIREKKTVTPIVVEVPSRSGTEYGAVAEYYQGYIRKFIGFNIVI